MKEDCLFCGIANGEESKLVWSNEVAAAFNDIHPKAPIHLLVVPKQHYETLDEVTDAKTAGELLAAVQSVAHQAGLKGRYKVAVNVGRPAGQIVDHLHFHVLGAKSADDKVPSSSLL
jgi:histidine triad (HIT) family protein